jgi:lipoate-protein ligase A
MGIAAELSGRNDLLAEGKKFSGNAQHSSGTRTLHHGTLLYNSDLSVLSSVLNVDEEKIRSKGIKSTRSRVINLSELVEDKTDVDGFIELVAKFVEKRYGILRSDPPENQMITKLRERNASPEWIFPERELVSRYSVRKKRRYDFGIVDIYLDMSNDLIKDIKINGDFFGKEPICELEAMLCGVTLDKLESRLSGVSVSEYIFGMNFEMLTEQLLK